MLYIDLLLSDFGLYQTLNSEDNAREACMGPDFLMSDLLYIFQIFEN